MYLYLRRGLYPRSTTWVCARRDDDLGIHIFICTHTWTCVHLYTMHIHLYAFPYLYGSPPLHIPHIYWGEHRIYFMYILFIIYFYMYIFYSMYPLVHLSLNRCLGERRFASLLPCDFHCRTSFTSVRFPLSFFRFRRAFCCAH